MNTNLRIGGVRFRFHSDNLIQMEESLTPFFCTKEIVSDVNVHFHYDFSSAPLPRSQMAGEDVLMEYYWEDHRLLSLTKGGQGRYLSSCICDPELRQLDCWLNFEPGSAVDTLGNLLRMIPLRRILLERGVLFFHASQIAVGNTGILFTAPSQTGKTTQARLWRTHRNARILCNDRTLTDGSTTYGFPVDGSEPVCSGECRRLGAIVILEQAAENSVTRLRPSRAVPRLMNQLVLDVWDADSANRAAQLLLELISRTPIYLLRCTPDEGAVAALEHQLTQDGVIL